MTTGKADAGRAWVEGLKEAVRRFAEARGIAAPSMRVTLSNGDWFDVHAAEAAIPGFVGFAVYPEDPADLERTADGAPVPARTVHVPLSAIYKVELDPEPQRDEPVGFFVEAGPPPA